MKVACIERCTSMPRRLVGETRPATSNPARAVRTPVGAGNVAANLAGWDCR